MQCKEKVTYHSAAMAEEARVDMVRRYSKDKRSTRFVCYVCRDCGLWHVGHLRSSLIEKPAAAPKQPKGPTPGEQRRAAAKAAEKAERQKFYQDYHDTLVFCRQLTDRRMAELVALGAKPRTVSKEPLCS